MNTLFCKICNKQFLAFPYDINRKYCSRKCYFEWRKENFKQPLNAKIKISKSLMGNKYRVGHKPWITGKKNIWTFAEKNVNWKGNNVGYSGLHKRIQRRKGNPKFCEKCGKLKSGKNSIHLANKSEKYTTEISDWIYLCPKCHRIFDISNGGGRRGQRNKFVPNNHIKSRE